MRFIISRLTKHHVGEEYLSTLNDSQYMRFSQHAGKLATTETQLKYLESFDFNQNFLLAITDCRLNRLVATATLRVNPENQDLNIGFLVLRSFGGQGIGKEIFKSLSSWVFQLFPTLSQVIGTRIENLGMQKIAISADFKLVEELETNNYVFFLKKPPPLPRPLNFGVSNIHVVCNDFGGSQQILALVSALALKASGTLTGPAVNLFTKSNSQISTLDTSSNLISKKIIILGSGFYGGPESRALECENLSPNYKIVMLDHWINYKERFKSDSRHLPNEFFVTNEKAEEIARGNFPQVRVTRIPDFLLAEQMRQYLRQEATLENVLFILEPEASIGEGINHKIGDLKQYFPALLAFCEERGLKKIVLRKHPSQKIDEDLDFRGLPREIEVCHSTNESLVEDLSSACAVFGFHSSALYASSMLGIETYSFFAGSEVHWTRHFPLIRKMN
jgi:RimJ/RimL family protein N-acetyltransferase